MSELISGKEALDAWYEGLEIEVKHSSTGWFVFSDHNFGIAVFKSKDHQFRLKPRTITINGIEVPAPFEPKFKDVFYYLDGAHAEGFSWRRMNDSTPSWFFENPVWRTEDEIKQVVAALRSIFK